MENVDSLEDTVKSPEIMSWIFKNAYFVALISVMSIFLIYKYLYGNNHLAEMTTGLEGETNFIETINNFLGKMWLSMNMQGNSISVDNEKENGLLDNIMKEIDVLHI